MHWVLDNAEAKLNFLVNKNDANSLHDFVVTFFDPHQLIAKRHKRTNEPCRQERESKSMCVFHIESWVQEDVREN